MEIAGDIRHRGCASGPRKRSAAIFRESETFGGTTTKGTESTESSCFRNADLRIGRGEGGNYGMGVNPDTRLRCGRERGPGAEAFDAGLGGCGECWHVRRSKRLVTA
ncbi:MAG: hypothetical protein WD490_07950 [Opitutales bacterium]